MYFFFVAGKHPLCHVPSKVGRQFFYKSQVKYFRGMRKRINLSTCMGCPEGGSPLHPAVNQSKIRSINYCVSGNADDIFAASGTPFRLECPVGKFGLEEGAHKTGPGV